ncbi:hypothetical protein BJ742DRAFT_772962 [Cladochytrium replicatum]|nr:hypothetical protein BJ742DRAFT_772962 [Cladochytrium replicatum]
MLPALHVSPAEYLNILNDKAWEWLCTELAFYIATLYFEASNQTLDTLHHELQVALADTTSTDLRSTTIPTTRSPVADSSLTTSNCLANDESDTSSASSTSLVSQSSGKTYTPVELDSERTTQIKLVFALTRFRSGPIISFKDYLLVFNPIATLSKPINPKILSEWNQCVEFLLSDDIPDKQKRDNASWFRASGDTRQLLEQGFTKYSGKIAPNMPEAKSVAGVLKKFMMERMSPELLPQFDRSAQVSNTG